MICPITQQTVKFDVIFLQQYFGKVKIYRNSHLFTSLSGPGTIFRFLVLNLFTCANGSFAKFVEGIGTHKNNALLHLKMLK